MANPNLVAANAGRARQASFYHGAQWDRLNADWVYGRLSADVTLRYDAQVLRNRARELVSNYSTTSAIPKLFSENVVGKDGIILQPMIMSSRGELNKRVNEQITEAWVRWGERGTCTTDGGMNWPDCQRLYTETKVTDGEVFVHLVRGFDNEFGFAIDFVDADQCDQYMNTTAVTGMNQVRMGIELDPWFRPVAYHMWTNHPSEPLERKRVRVPATEMVHSFYRFRGRQTRGVTLFAPLVTDSKMLAGYREGELVASRTSANKMGFIQYKDDTTPAMPNPGDSQEQIEMEAEPGVIEQLQPGQTFVSWDPQHPGKNFEGFEKAILRSIATGARISYMSISSDLQGTTYGSGRIGLLNERAVYQMEQERHVSHFDDPIYKAWLQMAVLTGQVDLPSGTEVREACRLRRWHARSFPWLDPKNDIEAASREVAMGVESLTRIAAQRGRDIEDVFMERQREMALAKQYGVPLVLDKGVPIGGPAFDTADPNADQPADEVAHPGPGEPGNPESDESDSQTGPGGKPAPSTNGNGKSKPTPGVKSRIPSRIRL